MLRRKYMYFDQVRHSDSVQIISAPQTHFHMLIFVTPKAVKAPLKGLKHYRVGSREILSVV